MSDNCGELRHGTFDTPGLANFAVCPRCLAASNNSVSSHTSREILAMELRVRTALPDFPDVVKVNNSHGPDGIPRDFKLIQLIPPGVDDNAAWIPLCCCPAACKQRGFEEPPSMAAGPSDRAPLVEVRLIGYPRCKALFTV